MSDEKEVILARAKATLDRLNAQDNDPEHIAYMEHIRRQAEQDRRSERLNEAVERARHNRTSSREDTGDGMSLESTPSALSSPTFTLRSFNVTLSEAEDLCRKAWEAPYVKFMRGNTPSLQGVCRHKALWLQQRLGGVVCSGWKAGEGYHAVLLVPIDGDLYVADNAKVVPLKSYPFFFEGMYERSK